MKGLRVTKIVKEIKFEGVWGELEAKKCFQRQSFPKYWRQTLFWHKIAKYKKVLISMFRQLFASINKIFILGRRLSTRL